MYLYHDLKLIVCCCRNNNNNDNNNNQVNTNIANSANMQISILKQSNHYHHKHYGTIIFIIITIIQPIIAIIIIITVLIFIIIICPFHMSTSMAMTGRQGWAERLRSVSFLIGALYVSMPNYPTQLTFCFFTRPNDATCTTLDRRQKKYFSFPAEERVLGDVHRVGGGGA